MYEAIQYYQSLAEKFDSRVMCVPGVIVVAVGLCIWLSGLRWRKVLGALAGGSFFAAIGLCLGDYGCVILLLVILIGMTIGALVEKIMLGVFGIFLAAAVVLSAVSIFSAKMNAADYSQNYPRWPQYQQPGVVISCSQSIEITKQTSSFILNYAIYNVKSASLLSIAAAVVATLAAGFLAMVMPRVFIAIISSSLGAFVISAGILMLLFYKGSKPVNYLTEKGFLYCLIIFMMLVFGTMVQLVLSPAAVADQKEAPAKKEKK
ncbi:MAG: hypothetical protein ABFD79_11800 [Phycisphaerales bacterium]